MTPKQKVEALLNKRIEVGCTLGEVIAANEMAVTLAIKYRIPSSDLVWPALPAGYRWEGQHIVPVKVEAPKAEPHPPYNHQMHAYAAGAAAFASRAAKSAARAKVWKPTTTRAGSKAAAVYAVLARSGGAHIAEIMMLTGWQPHTVRGWVSLENKKRLASGKKLIVTARSTNGLFYSI